MSSGLPGDPAAADAGALPAPPASADDGAPPWWERLRADADAVIPLVPAGRSPAMAAAAGQAPPKSGILVVDKPAGHTSHDVVATIRRASGERRVGHAGTLDPMATGVLVVCLGAATRVVDEIQATPKTYLARLRLGVRTDSGDADGRVVDTRDPSQVSLADVEAALGRYRGDILQTPPMVSAVKHAGQRLYALARQGIEVERAARPVTVHALVVVDWAPPELTLELRVSKGTYVRAIADDLGEDLGVGAHLTALRRTAVGPFRIDMAEPLARVAAAFEEGWWPALLHPLDAALLGYAAMVVDAARVAALRHGQQIEGPAPGSDATRLVRVYDADGRFVGLVAWDPVSGRWQPDRTFPAP